MNRGINQIAWTAGVATTFLLLPTSTQAASFDCAKVATKVEKLICSDAGLSKLDEDLSTAYKTALQASTYADSIKQQQKLWLKERNNCSDSVCVKRAYEVRLSALLSPKSEGIESEKLKRISEIATHQLLYVRRYSADWCAGFLRDLSYPDRSVEAIYPIFITEDEDDQRLKQYHVCDSGTEHRDSLGDDPKAEYWSIHDIGYHSFRLYQLPDLRKHQSVQVLYAELNPKEGMSTQIPGYGIVDFDRCRVEHFIGVYEGLQDTNRALENYNVMVRYHDTYYVLDAFDMRDHSDSKPSYWMDLKPVLDKKRTGFSCAWSSLPQE